MKRLMLVVVMVAATAADVRAGGLGPLDDVLSPSPTGIGAGARELERRLGLQLEGVDDVKGTFHSRAWWTIVNLDTVRRLQTPDDQPIVRFAPPPAPSYRGLRVRFPGLTIDRLTFQDAEAARDYGEHARRGWRSDQVTEVRGRHAVVVWAPGSLDPTVAAAALTATWTGKLAQEPRTSLTVWVGELSGASTGPRAGSFGAEVAQRLEAAEEKFSHLAPNQTWATPLGDKTTWLDEAHEDLLTGAPGGSVERYRRELETVEAAHGPDRASMEAARRHLRAVVAAMRPARSDVRRVPTRQTPGLAGALERP